LRSLYLIHHHGTSRGSSDFDIFRLGSRVVYVVQDGVLNMIDPHTTIVDDKKYKKITYDRHGEIVGIITCDYLILLCEISRDHSFEIIRTCDGSVIESNKKEY
jgi:hypothetical protein